MKKFTLLILFLFSVGFLSAQTVLSSESFENGGATPTNWAESVITGSDILTYVSTSTDPSGFVPTDGSYMVKFASYDVSGAVNRLYQTAGFSTVGVENITVNFDWLESATYAALDSVVVRYSIDGANWNRVSKFIRYNTVVGWKSKAAVLPVAAQEQPTVFVAFDFYSKYGNNCFLDNVVITGFDGPVVTASPTSIDFGNVTMGSYSIPKIMTVTNIGIGVAEISNISLTGTNADQFIISGMPTLPFSLTANQSQSFTVYAKPTAGGALSANLVITDNISDGTTTIPLSATGIVSVPQTLVAVANTDYAIDLDWTLLPDGELKYDDGTVESWYVVSSPSNGTHMIYTRYNSPEAANLSKVSVFNRSSNGPLSWQKIYVCPSNGNNAPDLANAHAIFENVLVSSTVGEWTVLDMPTPVALDLGETFYIVTHWGDGTGLSVGTDATTNGGGCAWSNTTGGTWTALSGNFLMHAYLDVAAGKESIVLTSAAASEELGSIPVCEIVAAENNEKEFTKVADLTNYSVQGISVPQLGISATDEVGSFTVQRGTATGVYTESFTGITETNYTDASGNYGTTYYYVVKSVSGSLTSTNSNEAFATVKNLPTAPTAPVPADAATDIQPSTSLSWTINGNTLMYDLYLSTIQDEVTNKVEAAKVVSNSSENLTSFTPAAPLDETTYYWRVVVRDNVSETEVDGDVWSFTVADVLAPAFASNTIAHTSSSTTYNAAGFGITDVSEINVTAGTNPRLYFKRSTDANAYNDNTNTTDGWKYVEANGATSPFDFTIDFTLLNGGTVTAPTTINYFVVAQDMAGTPNVGISAGTFAAAATSVDLVAAQFPIGTGFQSFNILPVLSSPLTVGTAGDFASLTAVGGLFEAINNRIVNQDIVVTITSDLTLETAAVSLNVVNEEGTGGYSITIQDDGNAHEISGTGASLIKLNGVDRVTFSGGSEMTNNLTFRSLTDGAVFDILAGSTDITINNCNIIGNNKTATVYGIKAMATGLANLNFLHNHISKAGFGIYAAGTSTYDLPNVNIGGNMIGSDVEAEYVSTYGIYVDYATDIDIHHNEIFNIVNTSQNNAIYMNRSMNAVIEGNNIHDILYTGTGGYGATGIWLISDVVNPNVTIQNNTIRHITGDSDVPGSTTSNWNPNAIHLSGSATSGINLYHNSIYMTPDANYGLAYTDNPTYYGAIRIAATIGGIDMRNNIFRASLGEKSTNINESYGYAIWCVGSVSPFAVLDNNIYFADNQDNNFVALVASAPTTGSKDLAAWQAFTGKDANSYFEDPLFVSETDLNLTCGTAAAGNGAYVGVDMDIVNEDRNQQAPSIGAYEMLSLTSEFTNNTSCTTPDGTITITAWGSYTGTLEYTVDAQATTPTWVTTNEFTALVAGSYRTGIRDAACEFISGNNIVITEPSSIVIDAVAVTDVTGCNGDENGIIEITATGGSGVGTQYSIDGGNTWENTNIFTGLPAANDFLVAVTDDGGCTTLGTENIVVEEPTEVVISNVAVTNVSGCYGNTTGAITITANGGTGAFTYSIDGGATYSNTTGSFTTLAAAVYNPAVIDANDCEVIGATVTVTQPTEVEITNEEHTNVTCFGGNNGTITLTAQGGTGILTYSINGGQNYVANGGAFVDLTADAYPVKVRDANLCIATGSTINVTEPDELVIAEENAVDVTCIGGEDGEIEIVAEGGTAPFSYSIDNGVTFETSGIFTDLIEGTYNVAVKDVNECAVEGSEITLTYMENPVAGFDFEYGSDGEVSFTNSSVDAIAYAWDFGDGVGISTDENPVYSYTANDTYEVILAAASEHCFSLSTQTVEVQNVGIDGINLSNVELYPNPAAYLLTINNIQNSTVSIYNLVGELVVFEKVDSNSAQINVANLAQGTYIVKVQNNNSVFTSKIDIIK